MAFSTEELCRLWLSAGGVTADRWMLLEEEFGSAERIWEAFGQRTERAFSSVQQATLTAMHSRAGMEDYAERLRKQSISVLFQESEEYPELLREIEDPPYVLYYVGDVSALARPMVAIIGTRNPSGYGKEMSRSIAKTLANAGVCVVSGLAYGIDGCAHEGALDGAGATVAVLGSGLNVPYPQEHTPLLRKIVRSHGLAVSEYPLDTKPMPAHFPHRNRIISGMSRAVVFVEGKIRSGGMITVSTALSQGREVFAVPGQIGTSGAEGPHTILREGARLITCAEDILEDLGLEAEESAQEEASAKVWSPRADMSPVQNQILQALARESMTMDGLCMATGIKAAELLPELSVMTIFGHVRKDAGNLFSIVCK